MSKFENQYNDVIKCLERFCEEQRLGTPYKGLELSKEFISDVDGAKTKGVIFHIDPMLPIDLVSVYSTEEKDEDNPEKLIKVNYYTLFWLVSAKESDVEKLGVRLQFYQFLLSRISDLKSVKIILVIPDGLEDEKESSLRKIAIEDGFGLLKLVDIEKPPQHPLIEARSFRDHMEDVLRNPPDTLELDPLPDCVKKKTTRVGLYLDLFVREAIDAVAGRTQTQAGKRYIDRILLEHVFNLNNVRYATELKKMVTAHLTSKGDDYDFVKGTFSHLWSIYFPKMEYSNILDISEFPLYHILAPNKKPYRDHYLHQFQVFILGSCILDHLMGINQPDIVKNQNIDIQWLITSSFHDMAYPLELYEDWAKDFFSEVLNIPDLGKLDIKSYFVDRSLLSSTGFIINILCRKHFNKILRDNWLDEEKELIQFFYDRISKIKHHSILSSLYLLKQAQSKHPELLKKLFVPSALAIVLHHYNQVFTELKQSKEPKEKDDIWEKLKEKGRVLSLLEFKTDPLAFLLMFCDSAQEWGRPKFKQPKLEAFKEDEYRFVLDECNIDKSGCSIKIKTPNLESIDEKFEVKDTELKTLRKFLRAPVDFNFEITLIDKSYEAIPHRLKCSK